MIKAISKISHMNQCLIDYKILCRTMGELILEAKKQNLKPCKPHVSLQERREIDKNYTVIPIRKGYYYFYVSINENVKVWSAVVTIYVCEIKAKNK